MSDQTNEQNDQQNENEILQQNLSRVCQSHLRKAEEGDLDSMFFVGESLIEGLNEFPKNVKVGLRYIIQASEREHVKSIEYYGYLLFKGEVLPKNEEQSKDILMKAAMKYNSSRAKYLLAQILFSHRTVGPNGFDDSNVDYVSIKKLAKEAADGVPKDPEAMVFYGLISEKEKSNKYGSITRDFNESFKYFKEAAILGDGDGMAYLGNYYLNGFGATPINKKLAIQYCRLSSKSGNLNGCALYGRVLIDGDGVHKNEREGVRLIKYSCDHGNPRGIVAYGYCLFYGISDLKVDKLRASQYFKMGADAGFHMGMNNYAFDLRDGIGTKSDINESIRYFKMAIEEGNILSARNLGIMLCKGFKDENSTVILEPNLVEGRKYLKYAADHSDASAMEEYVHYLTNQEDGQYNRDELKKYLQMGIDANNTYCMRYYGAILLDGDPFPKDVNEGARYYKMAVDLGDECAMETYGELLESGLGVQKNLVEARNYYQKSADLGDKDGIENYARFLEEGIGGFKSVEEAKKYRESLAKS